MNLLADRWAGLDGLPYASIAELPTPIENLATHPPFDRLDEHDEPLFPIHGLWVKRDDLTSPVYGGNKVRKLEYLLGAAHAAGARSVITFGAYGSNHALATAVHATRLGMEPHVVLSPQAPTAHGAATVLAHAGLGTRIHIAEDWHDAPRVAVRVRSELRERDGIDPYVFPAGGSSPVGAIGYVNAAVELLGQARSIRLGPLEVATSDFVTPDVVYVAAGTLGTAVGLAVGFAALEARTRVEAVRVTPEELASPEIAKELTRETVAALRATDPTFPDIAYGDLELRLRHDQYGAGYALTTPGADEAVELAAQAGLHLETTYTGKALSALVSDARAGHLREEHVVFWDTYSSAPKPPGGDPERLPLELQDWLARAAGV